MVLEVKKLQILCGHLQQEVNNEMMHTGVVLTTPVSVRKKLSYSNE